MVKVRPKTETFLGASGNRLIGDRYGEGKRAVFLLHGGGQTRHAFAATARHLAIAGWTAITFDQRGHGDSDWSPDGLYSFLNFAEDAAAIAATLADRFGLLPAVVGASLGGCAALIAEEEAAKAGLAPRFSAIVLVDVTPRFDFEGAKKIVGFMADHLSQGFASIEEAADAIASYLPQRPRPKSLEGLKKNLGFGPDGRWRWHWDPRFVEGKTSVHVAREIGEEMRVEAARTLRIPVLLVRGASSELVSEEHAREFLALAPQGENGRRSGCPTYGRR
jgi:pimeloyl-ACP methyl ester carboxylesterase